MRRVIRGLWLGATTALVAALLIPAYSAPQRPAAPLQPFAQHVRRVESAFESIGQPLPPAVHQAINDAIGDADERAAAARLEQVLDPHVLVTVEINPESRVKVTQGSAPPELVQNGTRAFLVKVINQAGVTSVLKVTSPNSGRVSKPSWGRAAEDPLSHQPPVELTMKDVRDRWADITIYDKPPMPPRLRGLAIEYAILQVYSRDAGQRSAILSFDVGQGTQDIGFRNEIEILFHAREAHPVKLRVRDEEGKPTTAGFVIRDDRNRVYPNRLKRLAPDLPFQDQVYRSDGETIDLPDGRYTVTVSRGPEYSAETRALTVAGPTEIVFGLRRWIDPSTHGWYSGDHHVHAAGCAHYENPTEGVEPRHMWPQVSGEALDIASVLTWGPCYYSQKRFFSGHDDPLSTPRRLLHYDLEVSGFPSSHAGHLVLLGLKDQDYPGATRIEQWPTWTMPILRWASAQKAVTGFAHSGWGLEVASHDLPNYEMPAFDGIGANEFIVDVTRPGTVDFISAGDTPPVWELNIWYHVLNAGFRTRISGETDFPCITDERVGQGRSYVKIDGPLSYQGWVDAIRDGRTYVSDGRSHLMNFAVSNMPSGGEVRLAQPGSVRATLVVAANLPEVPDEQLRARPPTEKPYWHLERARIGSTREVPLEIVVNGVPVAKRTVVADGTPREVSIDVPIEKSSWIAARILPSSHTNPVFVTVGDKPVRASRASAEWCLAAVNQCWTQKSPKIAAGELEQARAAYESARQVYRKLIGES
jgi:hypothetical protein